MTLIDIGSLIKPASAASPYLKLCIYGEYSCGKTTLAASAPKPLLVDTEGSAVALVKNETLKRTPTLNIRTLQEFVALFDWLRTPNGNAYETVIIDTISELSKHFLDAVIKENSSKVDAYTVPDGGYERRNQQGRRFLADLLAIPKHVILLAHVETVSFNGIDRKVPQLSTKVREGIMGLMDVVGYMFVMQEPAPTATDPGAMTKIRYIQTLATPTVGAKNRLDVPDSIPNPSISVFFDAHAKNLAEQAPLQTPVPNFALTVVPTLLHSTELKI